VETELSSGQVFPKRAWNPKKTTVFSFFIALHYATLRYAALRCATVQNDQNCFPYSKLLDASLRFATILDATLHYAT
jgi:hypothetical protein